MIKNTVLAVAGATTLAGADVLLGPGWALAAAVPVALVTLLEATIKRPAPVAVADDQAIGWPLGRPAPRPEDERPCGPELRVRPRPRPQPAERPCGPELHARVVQLDAVRAARAPRRALSGEAPGELVRIDFRAAGVRAERIGA